jgi:hypothetical protein
MQKAVAADEPGTLQYDLLQDEADPTTYRVFEIYESEDARKVHGKSAAFGAAAAPLGGGVMTAAPDVVPVKFIIVKEPIMDLKYSAEDEAFRQGSARFYRRGFHAGYSARMRAL